MDCSFSSMNTKSGSSHHHPLHGFSPSTPQPQRFCNLIAPPRPPPPQTAENLLQGSNFDPSGDGFFAFANCPPFPSLDASVVSSFLASAAPATPKPKARKRLADCSNSTPAPKAATQPCTECGKRFASLKALFGHMRCHPERQWRGINPPPHFRRARTLLLQATGSAAAFFTDEEYDVAASLLMLSSAPPTEVGGAVSPHPRFERKALGKRKRAWGYQAEAFGVDIHQCNRCDKAFSSGQALGGHKRCHWEEGESAMASSFVSRDFLLDLNMPPPVEKNEGRSYGGHALDLKLGI